VSDFMPVNNPRASEIRALGRTVLPVFGTHSLSSLLRYLLRVRVGVLKKNKKIVGAV
jgi:hypothetical protein